METTPRVRETPAPAVDEEVEAILQATDEVPPLIEDVTAEAGIDEGDDDALAQVLARAFEPDDEPLPEWEHVRHVI